MINRGKIVRLYRPAFGSARAAAKLPWSQTRIILPTRVFSSLTPVQNERMTFTRSRLELKNSPDFGAALISIRQPRGPRAVTERLHRRNEAHLCDLG